MYYVTYRTMLVCITRITKNQKSLLIYCASFHILYVFELIKMLFHEKQAPLYFQKIYT